MNNTLLLIRLHGYNKAVRFVSRDVPSYLFPLENHIKIKYIVMWFQWMGIIYFLVALGNMIIESNMMVFSTRIAFV